MPTYYLAPDPCQSTFLIPGSNTPGNGVKVFTYATGTTTKVTVAKDTAGAATHTNPIILDSGGNLPSGSSMFIEDGVVIDVVYAPSNDTDPPASAYKTISNVRGVEPTAAAPTEWISGSTATYVSATQFTVEGDQTATYHVGRRVRVVDSGGTKYNRITSTAFGSSTTVGLFGDALTTGASTLAYGILSATNPSTSLLTEFYPLVRSSTAAHTLTANLQSYTSSHVVTLPDYSFTLTSSYATSTSVDYLVSTFAPGIAFASSSGTTGITYLTSSGHFVKVGNLVTAIFDFTLSSKGSSTGAARIINLPFVFAGASYAAACLNISDWQSMSSTFVYLTGRSAASGNEILILGATSAAARLFSVTDSYVSNSTSIRGSISYWTP